MTIQSFMYVKPYGIIPRVVMMFRCLLYCNLPEIGERLL